MRGGVRVERQLRRLRWKLTAMFTAVTVGCLLTLAAVTATLDRRAEERALDADLSTRTAAVALTACFDPAVGRITVDDDSADSLVLGRPYLVVVVDWSRDPAGAVVYPARAPLGPPDLGALRGLRPRVGPGDRPVLTDLAGPSGGWRAAVVAVPGEGPVNAGMVVLVGDPAPVREANAELTRRLLTGCVVLAQLAAVGGYWLARFSMRPVVQALTRQEQFLAEAAHELRTPLAALLLVARGGLAHPARRVDAMRDTVRLADRLGHLVTSLLTRARLQAGTQRVDLVSMRLDQLVEQVVEDLPGADAVAVRAAPTVVAGDPDLLAQAVRNLTENALRHGRPAAGAAPVEVTVRDGLVEVRDHGPGPHRVGHGSAGTGIGLSIVRWVAELHGGEFMLVEAPDGGALATLRLPGAAARPTRA
ncbi:hypothetical protein GCM10010124_16730 [Pilimelia terevasa]|uniref:histidine kinase n=1 Tax=Pilimelia terevasa TaxID=53372 RepID=A0A8J3BMC5_9ACTN|nr:ATP-binding protein [Pilimelia terevasa]GGK24868.1 hypothetical protein GCM10010124_16730 [Pilimelia terevasa]